MGFFIDALYSVGSMVYSGRPTGRTEDLSFWERSPL